MFFVHHKHSVIKYLHISRKQLESLHLVIKHQWKDDKSNSTLGLNNNTSYKNVLFYSFGVSFTHSIKNRLIELTTYIINVQ